MDDTEDGFDKKRDHNQYGEVEKDKDDKKDVDARKLPKPKNKRTQNKSEK